jgi:hypothetical protein
VECLTCHQKMVVERHYTAPARLRLVCVNCEAIIVLNLTAEALATQYADEVAESALD